MENKLWYAVLMDKDDNDWGYGSFNEEEAYKMVKPFIKDGGYIAVIDDSNDPICIKEIHEFENEKLITYSYGDYYTTGFEYVEYNDGTVEFSDNNTTCELMQKIENPANIKFDEQKGWIDENKQELPWKE